MLIGNSNGAHPKNFTGLIDEVKVYGTALSASAVLARYNSMPNTPPNQPYTPIGPVAGNKNVAYSFTFKALDTDGESVRYVIDWGDGKSQTSSAVAYGTSLVSTHAWVNTGTFGIKVKAIDSRGATSYWSTTDCWSPTEYIVIYSTLNVTMKPPMIGSTAGVSASTTTKVSCSIGEPAAFYCVTGSTKTRFGCAAELIKQNNSLSATCPAAYMTNAGGKESLPPTKRTLPQIVALSKVSDIQDTLKQNLYMTVKDANGNMVISNNRWIKYDYDNRPIKVVTLDGSVTDFQYDHEGQRVRQVRMPYNAAISTSVYIGTIYEETYTGTTTEKISYLYAGSQRIGQKKTINGGTAELTYFHSDHLGSTHRITNTSGSVVRTNKYLPYGGTYTTSGTKDTSFKYTGQKFDDVTGLYYYNARYYDPVIGTFVTPDTIVQAPYDPQCLNRYAYCLNNPINLIDPSGNSSVNLGLERRRSWTQSSFLVFGSDYEFPDASYYIGDGIAMGHLYISGGQSSYNNNWESNSSLGILSNNNSFNNIMSFDFSRSGFGMSNQLPSILPNRSVGVAGAAIGKTVLNTSLSAGAITIGRISRDTSQAFPGTVEALNRSRNINCFGIYMQTFGNKFGLPDLPHSPEDALIVSMTAGEQFYKGQAWEYAAQKGLSYPSKSSKFRGLMNASKAFGIIGEALTYYTAIRAVGEAIEAEWEYAYGNK